MIRKVLLLGSTGLVGREVLSLLLLDDTVSQVTVVARRPSGQRHAKLREHVFPLDAMEEHPEVFAVDQIFCALGTTIKVAGSQEQFRRVDHDYPIAAARLGLAHGAQHYLLVSSLGANPRSRVFYNRVKGEVERDLVALGYARVTIARPSLLLGERTEFRIGERIASRLGFLMPPRYKPIEARTVARALVIAAGEDVAPTSPAAPGAGRAQIVESRELQAIAAR
jgi:uncharacterized protein YbjT (DUF2867 family)